MTTKHVVSDDQLGTIARREWEVRRRLMEGTLDPILVARGLQQIAEGRGVSETPVVTGSPFFASEEVASDYEYPEEYSIKPVCEQLVELSRHFPDLNSGPVLSCSKELPQLPEGAEGWFVVPKFERVAKTYNDAVEAVLGKIADSRKFRNYNKGKLGPKYLRLSERTVVALEMLGEKQEGDFLLIPAQFGLTHRGRSVRRVREIIGNSNEFGLGSFIIGCMILAHPERLVGWERLRINCPGDEYSLDADGDFSCASLFVFNAGGVKFYAYKVDSALVSYGPVSGFVPQS